MSNKKTSWPVTNTMRGGTFFPNPAPWRKPYRYAGYQYDNETGLYYLIARYYHPTHGVFLSLDPDPGDEDDILTQNCKRAHYFSSSISN
nr:RHS repeat-associated core domain-containing protein [Aeribacillus pallidus]